jgi:hypothetical protein
MVLYYCDLLFGLHPSSLCFVTTAFQGMVLPSSSGETYSVGWLACLVHSVHRSIDRTQLNRFHLMTREEPSLETLWLQNVRAMDLVQITDRSKSSHLFNEPLNIEQFHVLILESVCQHPCVSGVCFPKSLETVPVKICLLACLNSEASKQNTRKKLACFRFGLLLACYVNNVLLCSSVM